MDFESDEDVNIGKNDDVNDDIYNGEEYFGSTFANMNDIVPYVGMRFDSLLEPELFYRNYARSEGFEVIIWSTHKQKEGDDLVSRMYICRKGGRRGLNTPNDKDTGKGKRAIYFISRTKCEAQMCLTNRVNLNKWEVTFVKLEHNHGMVTPDKVQFIQRSRNIYSLTRSLIELFHKSGVETAKVLKLLSESCGGVQNISFSSQDIRNVIHDIRRWVFDSGDAECGLAFLRELKETCGENFFYRVDVDDENRVRGLVWVDSRSINAYKNFEYVSFNSTYQTNRYYMPFIPIMGVNHHYQNILFGFALMRDEKETSYKWVLKMWLESVDDKPPVTIITDQDIALGNAIAMIMPQTNHTYCLWHISNKFPDKLSSLYTRFPDFKKDFTSCVYKSLKPTEFEGSWEVLVEKYDLGNHVWLNEMYAIRSQWIRVYTKQYFSAEMTTTSRSESMNSFFDEYVKVSTGLKEFIENSQKALEK